MQTTVSISGDRPVRARYYKGLARLGTHRLLEWHLQYECLSFTGGEGGILSTPFSHTHEYEPLISIYPVFMLVSSGFDSELRRLPYTPDNTFE